MTKLPSGVIQPLLDHLPKLPSSAYDQTNGWVFTRLLKEYVSELVALSQVKDDSHLASQRAKVTGLFRTITGLGEQLKERNLDDDYDSDLNHMEKK